MPPVTPSDADCQTYIAQFLSACFSAPAKSPQQEAICESWTRHLNEFSGAYCPMAPWATTTPITSTLETLTGLTAHASGWTSSINTFVISSAKLLLGTVCVFLIFFIIFCIGHIMNLIYEETSRWLGLAGTKDVEAEAELGMETSFHADTSAQPGDTSEKSVV